MCTFIVVCLFLYVICWAHQYGLCLYSVVLPDESGISGQQTRMVRGSVNPVFNHTMVYDGFQSSDLIQACAEITVWNQHPSSCLGGVRLSTGSGNTDLNIIYLEYIHSWELRLCSYVAGVSYGQAVCWMDSTEDEISAWSSVIQCPNSWVDTSLPIRTNLQLCSDWIGLCLTYSPCDFGCVTFWNTPHTFPPNLWPSLKSGWVEASWQKSTPVSNC